jgi:hypothetical protein
MKLARQNAGDGATLGAASDSPVALKRLVRGRLIRAPRLRPPARLA